MKIMDHSVADKEICRLLGSMNPRGMDIMFDVYYKSLVVWANTFLNDLREAEDLVQEFFVFLWEKKDFQDIIPVALSSFLHISVRNRCMHVLKKNRNISFTMDLRELELANEEYNERYDEILARVEEEIGLLPPQSRKIVSAVFVEGMKYREVAERFNVSLSTVKTLIGSSVRKLRERMESGRILELLCILWSKNKKSHFFS